MSVLNLSLVRAGFLAAAVVVVLTVVFWPGDSEHNSQEVSDALVQLELFNTELSQISGSVDVWVGTDYSNRRLSQVCEEIHDWEREVLDLPSKFGSMWFGPGVTCGYLSTGLVDDSMKYWGFGNQGIERTKTCIESAKRRDYEFVEREC
jgi:hypothetical protein